MIPSDVYIGVLFVAAIFMLFLISQILEHGIGRVVMAVLAEAAIIIVIFAIGYFVNPAGKMGSLFAIVFSIASVIILWGTWKEVIRYGK
ncbi:MAG: hypothetical protein NTX42_00225 [Methanothrix sp.]|nr:hypothetical protein [Methanothrix sp.]